MCTYPSPTFDERSIVDWFEGHPTTPSIWKIPLAHRIYAAPSSSPNLDYSTSDKIQKSLLDLSAPNAQKRQSRRALIEMPTNTVPTSVSKGSALSRSFTEYTMADEDQDDGPSASIFTSTAAYVPFHEDPFCQPPTDEDTPRAVRDSTSASCNPPAFRLGKHPRLSPTISRTSSSQGTSIRSRSRSTSPTKRMGDLKLSDMDISMIDFHTDGHPLSGTSQSLYISLLKIEAGKGIIPACLADEIQELPGSHLLHGDSFSDSEHTGGQIADIYQSSPPSTLKTDELFVQQCFLQQVLRIYDSAKECKLNNEPESAWNSEVHAKLLNLALYSRRNTQRVWYRDVTTAKIQDGEGLLPLGIKKLPLQSKMVDYTLVLEETERVLSMLRRIGKENINHTGAENVRFSPIAVSIQTKRAAILEDDANVQLSIWVSAHFAKLRQLGGDVDALPELPLISVQGHEWKLKLAQACRPRGIFILSDICIGRTSTPIGVYQIIAALRCLARWADEDYRGWFERNVFCDARVI